jgi:type III pantothenate kinase
MIAKLSQEVFPSGPPYVVGTGGFARMFEEKRLFDEIVPELVLWGLKQAEAMNREAAERK